jgi:hypothetical protein
MKISSRQASLQKDDFRLEDTIVFCYVYVEAFQQYAREKEALSVVVSP